MIRFGRLAMCTSLVHKLLLCFFIRMKKCNISHDLCANESSNSTPNRKTNWFTLGRFDRDFIVLVRWREQGLYCRHCLKNSNDAFDSSRGSLRVTNARASVPKQRQHKSGGLILSYCRNHLWLPREAWLWRLTAAMRTPFFRRGSCFRGRRITEVLFTKKIVSPSNATLARSLAISSPKKWPVSIQRVAFSSVSGVSGVTDTMAGTKETASITCATRFIATWLVNTILEGGHTVKA